MTIFSTKKFVADNMTENDLLLNVVAMAKQFEWTVYHARPAMHQSGNWSTPTMGDNGFPDLCLCRRGRVIFAELKTMKGRVSPEQRNWLDELEGTEPKTGSVEVYVWRPLEWIDGTIERTMK